MFRKITPALVVSISLLAACGSAGPAIADPDEIVAQGVQKTGELDTFHLSVTLDGSFTVPEMGGQIDLDDVSLEGDLDVESKSGHLTFAMPSLFGLEGEFITDGTDMYTRMSLTGEQWTKTPVGEEDAPPVDPVQILSQVEEFLDEDGVETEKLDDVDCGDRRCYLVRLTVPAEVLAQTDVEAPVDAGDLVGEALVLDLQFDRENLWLTSASTSLASEEVGTFSVRLTLSAFNENVDIELPPADQVTEGEPTLPF